MNTVISGSLKHYKEFIRELYSEDINFKDNKTSLIDIVCGRNSAYRKNSTQTIVAVREDGRTLCQCVFIRHQSYPKTLMGAFFEARQNADEAVSLLLRHGERLAADMGCENIAFGVDGHCNYFAGFLTDGCDQAPCFGQAYNPPYYGAYFQREGYEPVGFTSLWNRLEAIDVSIARYAADRSVKNIALRYSSFGSGFRETMKRYTDLNNAVFANHRYYFHRSYEEDRELFAAMRPILKGHNLIWAEDDGQPVGFVLWYPDFNCLVPPGKGAGAEVFLKYRLFRRMPEAIKIVEIGVLPEYESRGVILKLLLKVFEIVRQNYPQTKQVISSWILEENSRSLSLSAYFLKNSYKRFESYEKKI